MDFSPFSPDAGIVAQAELELAERVRSLANDDAVQSVSPASASLPLSASAAAAVALGVREPSPGPDVMMGFANGNGAGDEPLSPSSSSAAAAMLQPEQPEAKPQSKSASPALSFQFEASSSPSPQPSQDSAVAVTAAAAPTPPPAISENPQYSRMPIPETLPSPGREVKSVLFQKQLSLVKDSINQQDASVVRQAVRDLWQKCLFGSEFHVFFLTNAVFRHAPPETLAKVLDTFGKKTVKYAKHELINHFAAGDFDELVDVILSKISNQFMDQILARRLETIPAQDLINALARAERLGYELDDVVDGGKPGDQPEQVIPSRQTGVPLPGTQSSAPHSQMTPVPVPSQHVQKTPFISSPTSVASRTPSNSGAPPAAPPAAPSAASPVPQGKLPRTIGYCEHCGRPCSTHEALLYHYKRANCHSNPQTQGQAPVQGKDFHNDCVHCGVLFTSSQGLNYHSKSGVCGHHSKEMTDTMTALLKSWRKSAPTQTPQKAVTPAFPTQAYPYTPSQSQLQSQSQMQMQMQTNTPTPMAWPPPQAVTAALPNRANTFTLSQSQTPTALPSQTPKSGRKSGGDPYAHLGPEQRLAFEAEMDQAQKHYSDLFKKAMQLPTAKEQEDELTKLKNRYNTKQSTTRKKYGIRLRERRSAADMEAERAQLLGVPSTTPEQPAKRARLDSQAQTTKTAGNDESPRRRVPLTEMGGLTGSQATAEMVDPTAVLTPSQPPRRSTSHIPLPATATQHGQNTMAWAHTGTPDDPMQIDDDNSDMDDDDDDIPAQAPTVQSI